MSDPTQTEPLDTPGTPKIVDTSPEPRVYDVNQDSPNKSNPIIVRPIILGDLTLGSPTTFTTIGANGAATALTANPVGYLVINIGNSSFQVPYFNLA